MLIDLIIRRGERAVTEQEAPVVEGDQLVAAGTIARLPRMALSFFASSSSNFQLVLGEIPTGLINGVNMSFSTLFNFTGILVYLNGLRLHSPDDYTIFGPNTFLLASPPLVGDSLIVDYIR